MATDIETFCRSCRKCQTNKTDMQKPQGLLHSLPIPDKLWQLVGMDFMGPLPWSQGNDYSDSKNPFHTNPKCGVRSALPYSMGILLSLGRVIHSTYPWLQDCSLAHVIWATGCRDMINLKQQYHGKGFLIFELMNRISVKS